MNKRNIKNKRRVGTDYENMACEYLVKEGYEILERNFYDYHKEIDIIARKDGVICFIEVKYRSSDRYGFPHDSITGKKVKSIISAAQYYLYSHGAGFDEPVSFDCILIMGQDITHIKNAFDCSSVL